VFVASIHTHSRDCIHTHNARVRGLSAMFAQFDRPDWDGSTDRSIDVVEFTQGLQSLRLNLSEEQIRDVFNMVDKNGEAVHFPCHAPRILLCILPEAKLVNQLRKRKMISNLSISSLFLGVAYSQQCRFANTQNF
jgi:hypothetical protein